MTPTLALLAVPHTVGYTALAALVGAEAAGVPVPGETTLLACAVLAKAGSLSIVIVIAIAAAAAILGDNLGYLIARRLGRSALERPGRWQPQRLQILARGEQIFARHGAKAVFLGRWMPGLRVWASWLAGITHMPWRQFLAWNALGGITWAITVGVAGYLLGSVAERIFAVGGFIAAAAIAALALLAIVVWRLRRRRVIPRRSHARPGATSDTSTPGTDRGDATRGRAVDLPSPS
jgi:membrane protein DedA with SNARE-associated domain